MFLRIFSWETKVQYVDKMLVDTVAGLWIWLLRGLVTLDVVKVWVCYWFVIASCIASYFPSVWKLAGKHEYTCNVHFKHSQLDPSCWTEEVWSRVVWNTIRRAKERVAWVSRIWSPSPPQKSFKPMCARQIYQTYKPAFVSFFLKVIV